MLSKTLRITSLTVLGLLWLVPLYLFIVNASKSPSDYNSNESWLPGGFNLIPNAVEAWQNSGLGAGVFSSVIYSVVAAAIAVLLGAMVGYAIIALRVRHGFAWFVFVFGASVIPLQMIILPLFNVYADTGLFDTHIGMVIAYSAVTVPFAAFVMRNFFSGVSYSMFEAALMDGASSWRIFIRVYLPMASSALVAVFILQATSIWNDLLIGLTLSQSDEVRPIVPILNSLQGNYANGQVPTALAAAVIVSLPTMALFFAAQRFFTKGLALGQY